MSKENIQKINNINKFFLLAKMKKSLSNDIPFYLTEDFLDEVIWNFDIYSQTMGTQFRDDINNYCFITEFKHKYTMNKAIINYEKNSVILRGVEIIFPNFQTKNEFIVYFKNYLITLLYFEIVII